MASGAGAGAGAGASASGDGGSRNGAATLEPSALPALNAAFVAMRSAVADAEAKLQRERCVHESR